MTKALVLREYMKLVYEEVWPPEIAPDEVLVRVAACGICGSDVHGLDGSTGRRQPPRVMGHEASGLVEAVGPEVRGWTVGERVTFDSTIYRLDDWYTRRGLCNLSDGRMVLGVSTGDYRRHGAFADYVAVPQHILYRVPDTVTFEQAAMVERWSFSPKKKISGRSPASTRGSTRKEEPSNISSGISSNSCSSILHHDSRSFQLGLRSFSFQTMALSKTPFRKIG